MQVLDDALDAAVVGSGGVIVVAGEFQKHLLRQDVARKVENAQQVPADA